MISTVFQHDRSAGSEAGSALLAALAALLAAWPVLGNYFFADDFANMIELANFGPGEFITAPAAGHMSVVRNAVFYLTFRLFGMQPEGYFAIVLATHVANVVLLFALVRRLTGSAPIALLGAVLFGVSPTNAGTLGWYSVYGQALATTFALGALLLVVPRPHEPPGLGTRAAVGAACCMLAASQCFGTGAALAFVLPLVVVSLRPGTFRSGAAATVVAAVPVLVVAAWIAINARTTRLNPAGMTGVETWLLLAADYRSVVVMTVHLFALGTASLVLGASYPLSRYPDAISTATVVAFVGAAVAALCVGRPKERRVLLVFLAAALACYTAVAAGRAALLAVTHRTAPQVLAGSTRYHYLGQTWLSVVVALILAETGRRLPLAARTKRLLLGGWAAWAAVTGLILRPPVAHFDTDRARVAAVSEHIAREVRRASLGSTVCLPIEPAPLAIGFPGSLGVFMLMHRSDELEGRRVRFVSKDPSLLARRTAGGRMQQLLLPEGECPPREG